MKKAVFLFHRDLRLEDNTGLIECLKNHDLVLPLFILDDKQLKNNPYRGKRLIQFMVDSLKELDLELKGLGSQLHLMTGKSEDALSKLLKDNVYTSVYSNHDYTPFSRKRDAELEKVCRGYKVSFKQFHDALLHSPGTVLKQDGLPYTVYTPYFRKAREIPIQRLQNNKHKNYELLKKAYFVDIDFLNELEKSSSDFIPGGRKAGLKLLSKLKNQESYADQRDIPFLNSTTHLSAHHKFGTISIRETHQKALSLFGKDHGLIGELHWRDFFTQITFHFPHVFEGAFRKKYDDITWDQNENNFKKWCEGKTGFPIVDAGMRELNETGYMHNRVRMITASFLVKDLHIDWRKGERYFAQKLVDYDPAVNNGNWQWAASTGCDAQPYFRIFNPWRQQERFDPEASYIKKWVPELKNLDAKSIHRLFKGPDLFSDTNYPSPMVDHSKQAAAAKLLFKEV